MERKKLERFPEGVLEHIARIISDHRTGSEIAELLAIAGYSKGSLVQGTKWRFLYETFKRFQIEADGQYHVAKVIQVFCDPTQWIGRSSNHRQALEILNEGLILVDVQLNREGKLIATEERIAHIIKEKTENNSTESKQGSSRPNNMTNESKRSQVFVVHGRNEEVRRDIFSFLRAIGLEPIEWTKAVEMTGKAAPYVGEILDAALDNAQAIVVVMTPDDEARLRQEHIKDSDNEYERELTPQPRPNVLFEAGLALGRAPNQTVLVEIGRNRPFSDIAGRHTIRLNNTTETRQALASRLETAGCSVNLGGTDWHREGNFEISEAEANKSTTGQVVADGSSSSPRLSTTSKLTANEVKILKLLGDSGKNQLTVAEIAAQLDIHPTKAEYFLEQLEDRDYLVAAHYWTGQPSSYALYSKGRAYLVEHNLV